MHRRAFICVVLAAFSRLASPAAFADDMPAANGAVYKQPASMRHVALDQRGRLRLVKGDEGYAAAGEFVSRPIAMGEGGHVRVDWIGQWTTPQRWKKHPGNPIYGPELSVQWDTWTNGVSIDRNPDDKTYKMFYCGRAGAGIGFAEASIDVPLTWKEHASSPVLKPLANWEGNTINQPRVVKVTDQHWRLYYTGWGYEHPNGGSRWAFNLAESFDGGVTWKRHSEGPLVERGDAASPDGGGVCVRAGSSARRQKVDDVVHGDESRLGPEHSSLPGDFRERRSLDEALRQSAVDGGFYEGAEAQRYLPLLRALRGRLVPDVVLSRQAELPHQIRGKPGRHCVGALADRTGAGRRSGRIVG